eukprot:4424903-Pyramimonas_sp.AAC.1
MGAVGAPQRAPRGPDQSATIVQESVEPEEGPQVLSEDRRRGPDKQKSYHPLGPRGNVHV